MSKVPLYHCRYMYKDLHHIADHTAGGLFLFMTPPPPNGSDPSVQGSCFSKVNTAIYGGLKTSHHFLLSGVDWPAVGSSYRGTSLIIKRPPP